LYECLRSAQNKGKKEYSKFFLWFIQGLPKSNLRLLEMMTKTFDWFYVARVTPNKPKVTNLPCKDLRLAII